VGWATMGIRPPDERRELFDGEAGGLAMIRRSVPIGSLTFLEVRFYYEGEPGKRTPAHLKTTVRGTIANQVPQKSRDHQESFEDIVPAGAGGQKHGVDS